MTRALIVLVVVGLARVAAAQGSPLDVDPATVHGGKYTRQECTNCHVPARQVPPPVATSVQRFHGVDADFPLVDKHAAVPCADCHKQANVLTGLTPWCGSCHEDVLHAGSLGDDCNRCHVSGTWEPLAFDHARSYPLRGAHAEAACTSCHPGRVFARTARACGACHEDAHAGRLGTACERCHDPTGDITFDHQSQSAFRLDGKHLAVACADCHPSRTFKPRPTACAGCHPDPHRGRFGACDRCHSTRTFANFRR